ncbi:hypothetical protein FPL14_29130 [Cohnella cholangitidis]|uniref:Uncharacterized protein n=2 Tax=Cohnella cholangitidis TaxID=2598458 RepID=A0A7G5C7Q9_9BACL|nr:hypothetical protein FPL14_29130 [Cohnella cholangitidis]
MKDVDGNNRKKWITPVDLMEHLLSYIHKEDQIDSVIYVAQMNDGTISSGWTDLTYPEAIGLLEVGKLQVFNEMETNRATENK